MIKRWPCTKQFSLPSLYSKLGINDMNIKYVEYIIACRIRGNSDSLLSLLGMRASHHNSHP